MASTTLTDARVRALSPRKSARDIRDAKLKGFGVRVLPSGAKRWFVHCQHDGRRICYAEGIRARPSAATSYPVSAGATIRSAPTTSTAN